MTCIVSDIWRKIQTESGSAIDYAYSSSRFPVLSGLKLSSLPRGGIYFSALPCFWNYCWQEQRWLRSQSGGTGLLILVLNGWCDWYYTGPVLFIRYTLLHWEPENIFMELIMMIYFCWHYRISKSAKRLKSWKLWPVWYEAPALKRHWILKREAGAGNKAWHDR